MNPITISHPTKNIGKKTLNISGSKSESNRVLILQALLKNKSLLIDNLSTSQDTDLMKKALQSKEKIIDIHHAGTAMRFLTAYFAVQDKRETILTGSTRMKERPIGILVDALRQLGAEIDYLKEEGFPPLLIKGKKLTKNEVTLSANVSSQYISALLLIAGFLENGLSINLEGSITSLPYLQMTNVLLNGFGIETKGSNYGIDVKPINNFKKEFIQIESDWSSASYLYSIVALSNQGNLKIKTFHNESLQGDSAIIKLFYHYFNTETTFQKDNQGEIKLTSHKFLFPPKEPIIENLNHCPDIAQTILVTAAALKIPCKLTGLHTLKIKETDRILAMKNELTKCNVETICTDDSIEITHIGELPKKVTIETYNDHRMAMAFTPLALMGVELKFDDKAVVEKSYPNFWNDMQLLGFTIQ